MKNLRQAMYDTAFEAGIPIISDDKCCRLLAWLYVYGGGCEAVVLDEKLNAAIIYAQKRLNIFDCERPDAELLPVYRDYVKSTGSFDKPNEPPPEWVPALEKEYGINRPRVCCEKD